MKNKFLKPQADKSLLLSLFSFPSKKYSRINRPRLTQRTNQTIGKDIIVPEIKVSSHVPEVPKIKEVIPKNIQLILDLQQEFFRHNSFDSFVNGVKSFVSQSRKFKGANILLEGEFFSSYGCSSLPPKISRSQLLKEWNFSCPIPSIVITPPISTFPLIDEISMDDPIKKRVPRKTFSFINDNIFDNLPEIGLEKVSDFVAPQIRNTKKSFPRKVKSKVSFVFKEIKEEKFSLKSIFLYLKNNNLTVKDYLKDYFRLKNFHLSNFISLKSDFVKQALDQVSYQVQGLIDGPSNIKKLASLASTLSTDSMKKNLNDLDVKELQSNLKVLVDSISSCTKIYEEYSQKFPNASLADSLNKLTTEGVAINLTKGSKMSIVEVIVVILLSVYLILTFDNLTQTVALLTLIGAAFGLGTKLVNWLEGQKDSFSKLKQWFGKRTDQEEVKEIIKPKVVDKGTNVEEPTPPQGIDLKNKCRLGTPLSTPSINSFDLESEIELGADATSFINSTRDSVSFVNKSLESVGKPESWDFKEFSSVIAPASKLLASGIATVMSTDDRPIPTFIKAGQFASSFNNVKNMGDALKVTIDGAHDLLWEYYTGLPYGLEKMEEFALEIDMWFETYNKTLGDPEWLRGAFIDNDSAYILQTLLDQGRDFQTRLASANKVVKDQLRWKISETIRVIQKYKETLEASKGPGGLRQEPVCIVALGGTGIGKTTLLHRLAIDLFNRMPKKYQDKFKSVKDLTYGKSEDEKGFYDGYNSQMVLFKDEMFQNPDKDQCIKEGMELYNIVNTHTVPVNIAVCELKNKIVFNSPFVYVTSNREKWRGLEFQSIEALLRRRDLVFIPEVKQPFRIKDSLRLDAEKWKTHCNDNNLDPNIPDYANFKLIDPLTEEAFAIVSYNNLLNRVWNKFLRKQDTFVRSTTFLEDAFTNIKANPRINEIGIIPDDQLGTYQPQTLESPYVPQVNEVLLNVRKLIDEKRNSKSHQFLQDVEIVPNELFDYFSTALTVQESAAYFGALPLQTKIDLYIFLCSSFHLDRVQRVSIVKRIVNGLVPWDDTIVFKDQVNWAEYKVIIANHQFPLLDWRNKVSSWFKQTFKNFPYKPVILLLTGLATITTIGGLFYYFAHKPKTPPQKLNNNNTSSESRVYSHNNITRRRFKKGTPSKESEDLITELDENQINEMYEQALMDPSWESMKNVVIQNCVHIKIKYNTVIMKQARGIIVKSGIVLVPLHLIKGIEDSNYLISFEGITNVELKLQDCSFHYPGPIFGYDDVAFIKVPNFKLMAKDISNYFIKEGELTQVYDTFGELMIVSKDSLIRHATHIFNKESHKQIDTTFDVICNQRVIDGWYYDAATDNGDCGSPLVRWDPKSNTKILGIHAAGSVSKSTAKRGAFAVIVTQEIVKEAFKVLHPNNYSVQGIKEDSFVQKASPLIKNTMYTLGLVPDKERIYLPLKEFCAFPSPLTNHLPWKNKTKPVKMTVKGEDSSLSKVLDKYTDFAPYIDNNLLYKLEKAFLLKTNFPIGKGSLINDWEKCLNVLGNLNSIKLNSSMGYPWNLKYKKTDFVYYDDKQQLFKFKDNEFIKKLDEFDSKLQIDMPKVIWLNYLKGERLPIEKVDEQKVRMFMACPFDFSLVARKYFGDFISYLHKEWLTLGCCVGIDPHSEDWHHLTNDIISKNSQVLAIDYSNWDRTVPLEFLNVFFDLADFFYQDQHKEIRDKFRTLILNPIYQLNFFQYFVVTGNPSGSPFTAEMNSLANIFLISYCLIKVGFSIEQIFSHFCIKTYGDDCVMSSSLEYDVDLLINNIRELGLKVTNIDKSSNIFLQDLSQINFLKRRFVLRGSQYVGPLELDVIREMVLWVTGTNNIISNLTDTVRSAFEELKICDPEESLPIYKSLIYACNKINIPFPISDHLINVLTFQTEQEGKLVTSLFINAGMAIWSQLASYSKYTISLPFNIHSYGKIYYVGLDIGKMIPGIDQNIVYHVGFRFENYDYEISFTDKGVAAVPITYTPDFNFEVDIDQNKFEHYILHPRKYHRTFFNCITWCEYVMIENPKLIYKKCQKFILDNFNNLSGYEKQVDDQTLSSNPMTNEEVEQSPLNMTSLQPFQIAQPSKTRTINQLLETEALIDTYFWKTSNVLDDVIAQIDFPEELLKSDQFFIKTKYNSFLTANLRVWIRVTTTQFHQGSLYISWIPLYNLGMPADNDIHVYALTSMPGVLFNASVQNECIMDIPFTHVYNMLPQDNKSKTTMGTLFIKVINPLLTSGGSTNVPVVVMANFVNVQLSAPSPLSDNTDFENSVYPYVNQYIKQNDESQEKTEKGIITNVSSKIKGAVDLVSGIPFFQGVASTVGSVANTVSNVAQILGLSKPTSIQSTIPYIPRPFSSASHMDGLDMSCPLAISPNNYINIQPSMFGSNVDEMSFPYLLSIPQLLEQFEWSALKVKNQTIVGLPVTPLLGSKIKYQKEGKAFLGMQLTPMGYVAMGFTYWRGTIRFKIQVIATSFHKGTLVIGFLPRSSFPHDQKLPLEVTSHVKLDLGKENNVEFSIPFVSPLFYNKVGSLFDTLDLESNIATGMLVIKVLNPLIVNNNISNKVHINVWVSGDKDMEFALPTLENINRVNYGYKFKEQLDLLGMEMQGNTILDEVPIDRSNWIMGNSNNLPNFDSTNIDVNNFVMGESIKNLRDLLKISVQKFSTCVDLKAEDIKGFSFPVHSIISEKDEIQGKKYDTFYDHFMRIFRFSRGSIRHKVVVNDLNIKLAAIVSEPTLSPKYLWRNFDIQREGSPWAICIPKLNPTLEYSIPFYSQYKMNLHGDFDIGREVTLSVDFLDKDDQHLKVLVYESIGDDFSAGYFTGPPVITRKKNNTLNFFKLIAQLEFGQKIKDNKLDGYYPIQIHAAKEVPKLSIQGSDKPLRGAHGPFIYYPNALPAHSFYMGIALKPLSVDKWVPLFKIKNPEPLKEEGAYILYFYNNVFYNDSGSFSISWNERKGILTGMWLYVELKKTGAQLGFIKTTQGYDFTHIRYVVGDAARTSLLTILDRVTSSGKLHFDY